MARMPNDVINEIYHDGYTAGYDEGFQAAIKHGRWIDQIGLVKCPFCQTHFTHDEVKDYNYCPNCGAKMDGGDTDG